MGARPGTDRKRVLLAYECVSGLGHLTRLADVARRLKRHGIESILASFRLDDADRFADSFDRVVQAPVWPMHFAQERSIPANTGPSFATALANMGFREARYIAANQRAWGAMFDDWKPDVVIADFAPGAILAAKGRCPSLQIGGPFSTPALDQDLFPPFMSDQSVDGVLEQEILSAIEIAARQLGRPVPEGLHDAVIADESLPMGFAEFDPYLHCRHEPLLSPDMVSPRQLQRGSGDTVFAYLPEWMQHNDVLMATLCALKTPVRLFVPNLDEKLAHDLRSRNVVSVAEPFSVEEIAHSAVAFLHHGGLGACQIGLIAGAPQIALEADREKMVNGRAITSFNVGQSLNYHRLTLPKLRDAIWHAVEDAPLQQRAAAVASEVKARLTGPHPHDIVVERVLHLAA